MYKNAQEDKPIMPMLEQNGGGYGDQLALQAAGPDGGMVADGMPAPAMPSSSGGGFASIAPPIKAGMPPQVAADTAFGNGFGEARGGPKKPVVPPQGFNSIAPTGGGGNAADEATNRLASVRY